MATEWKKLQHALGPATRVPQQVKALLGAVDEEACDGARTLRSSVVGANAWFTASAPTVVLLLDKLPQASRKAWVLGLLGDLLGADHIRGWLSPRTEGLPADVREALESGAPSLLKLLAGDDATVRAGVLCVLAMAPSLAKETLPVVQKHATSDRDEVVRASAILALGRLGEGDDATRAMLTELAANEPAIVRGAAAVARLRMDPGASWNGVRDGIEAWLGCRIPTKEGRGTVLPWFGGVERLWDERRQFLMPTSQGLVALARSRGDTKELIALALGMAAESSVGLAVAASGEMLLALGGLTRFRERVNTDVEVAAIEELSEQERAIVTALAKTPARPQAGCGLPAGGHCRRRWIGLLPAGPLETVVDYTISGTKCCGPFWQAWVRLSGDKAKGNPIPEVIDDVLSALDRWYAIVEFGLYSYGGLFRSPKPDLIEAELAKVRDEPKLLARIAEVADELAMRFAEAEREGVRMNATLLSSALLLVPLVRANKPIEPRWDRLVVFESAPHALEIVQALPADRREAAAFARTSLHGEDRTGFIGYAVAVFHLVPSERMARWIVRVFASDAGRKLMSDAAKVTILERVRKVADQEPTLRGILKPLL